MINNSNDQDLNLQSFNDHGIFTIEEINELSSVVKLYLSVLHLNIRSLRKHFDELCNLLDFTPLKFNSIAYIETWITPQADPNQFQISGYNIITDNRISSIDGGFALFLKEDVDYCLQPT